MASFLRQIIDKRIENEKTTMERWAKGTDWKGLYADDTHYYLAMSERDAFEEASRRMPGGRQPALLWPHDGQPPAT